MLKKISKNYLLFLVLAILIFCGAFNKTLTFISIIMSFIISYIIAKKSYKTKDYTVCVGIICMLVFQNFLIGTGAHIASNSDLSLKYLTQIPFITIFTIWINIILSYISEGKFHFEKSKTWFVLLLCCIAFAMVINRGNIQSMLINIRNLTVFFMAYEIAKEYIDTKEKMNRLITSIMQISIFLLLCGIILLIFGYDLYKIIGIDEVFIAKGSTLTGGKLDNRFYTTLISRKLLRMGSLYYEPVNLAYFFSLSFLVSVFFYKNKGRKLLIILNLIGLILTFGKGGYLLTGICIGVVILFYAVRKILFRTKSRKILKVCCLLIVLAAIFFSLYYYKNIGAASSPHFWAVARTWKSVLKKPYGYGLGTGGNMSLIFNTGSSVASYDSNWLSTGGETALMSFMYQIGIQGAFCLIMCMLHLAPKINSNSKPIYIITYFMPIALLGISLLQDNTFTPQCIVTFMMIIGAVKSLNDKEIKL